MQIMQIYANDVPTLQNENSTTWGFDIGASMQAWQKRKETCVFKARIKFAPLELPKHVGGLTFCMFKFQNSLHKGAS